ncbi:MAG: hypothetical protein ABUS56_04860, partial [Acidobacteriota bacterium]
LDLKRLRRVQNILGQLHDRQVLADRVRAVQASLTPPDITIWRGLDAVLASLEGECRRLHGRYMHEREGLVALSASRVTRAPTPSAAVDKPRPKRSVR